MAHIDEPPPCYEEVVSRLRARRRADPLLPALSQCTRRRQGQGQAGNPRGKRTRRLFDIGHGKGSFSWKSARAMMAAGFQPDTISSDIHALCIEGPAYDQVTTLSKFLALGMSINDIIAASTVNAAKALRRPELGTFKIGSRRGRQHPRIAQRRVFP